MNIEIKSPKYQAFAGISFVFEAIRKTGFKSLVDAHLGMRCKSVGYSYSEIIENLFYVFYCGGGCVEDAASHLGGELRSIARNKVPSPDTILRGIKELASENTIYTSSKGISYNFNINSKLNELLIKSLLLTGGLKVSQKYDFDYDNQLIPCEKYDTKYSYKKCFGYFPGVATIDDKIVYIENRDGNANVKFEQAQTLERAYSSLGKEGVRIHRSRMDCGSYAKDIIEVVDKHSDLFYIRAQKSETLYDRLLEIEAWETVEINFIKYEVASLPFTSFALEKNYRLVIMREKTTSKQADLFTGDACRYRSILTNDHSNTEKEIILYYNARGTNEKVFDVMNNDFGWNSLPCSFINENTVFMILMAIAMNFYLYFIEKVSSVFDDLRPTSRLKRFIFRFITVVGRWTYRARGWYLQLFTVRPYDKLII